MLRKVPKQPPAPTYKPDSSKLRGSVERDEGPALEGKPGYRNSDELENVNDARHEDPVGV
jgi:hypothetical protein